MLSVDKTTATADSTDAVTITATYTKGGKPVSGATVGWQPSQGTMSARSSKTNASGVATAKLTSDTAGTITVTAYVDDLTATSEGITFSAA